MTVGITGASGKLGRETAERLLELIDATDLVLVTRAPERLGDYAERGVVVRRGDFEDPASLPGAFAGVERLLVISADKVGQRIELHRAAVDGAVRAGVRHILYTSICNPTESNPAGVIPDHRATEEAIRASGLEWTFLRNGIYADYRVPAIQQAAANGRFVHNWGDGGTAFVARVDLAAVAAAVLATDGHEGLAYDVTGPELIVAADIAAIASELRGSEVEAVAVDDDTWVAGMVEQAGLPEDVARLLASFGRAYREGQMAQLSSAVADLTGRTPTHLRDLALAAAAVA
jgi:NAD(P)H dehydrogenase (quinone)